MKIKSAAFVTSAKGLADSPVWERPEFAFIGRSNVGKSSMINLLAQRKELAKVSATPGKTRLINFFLMNETWSLVDLPGYGFAKTAKSEKFDFNKMIGDYIPPISPPSGPSHWLFQWPPAESKFLAARDMFDKFSHKSRGDLRGSKAHIWEGGYRVPLIVRWPGKVKASTTSDQVICLTDFIVTSAAIVGADLPDDAAEDSVNMLPALLGQSSPDKPLREAIVHHSSDGVFAIRQGKWKLIPDSQESGGWPPPRGGAPVTGTPGQLYNLEVDPGEQTNLWDKHKDIVAILTTLLERYQKDGRSVPTRK